MMKKLLLSLGFVLMATIASMSQFVNEIDNVVVPASVEPGEEITVTFDYLAVDPDGFFRFIISNNDDQATFWDAAFGAKDWAPLLDADDSGEWISASVTFEVPFGVEFGERLFKLRMETIDDEGQDADLVVYNGVLNVSKPEFSGSITSYTAPTASIEIGSQIEFPLTYTSSFTDAQVLEVFFVSAGVDGGAVNWKTAVAGDNTAPGNHGWEPKTVLTKTGEDGEEVEYVASVIVPASIEFISEDLPEGQEWRLGVKAFGVTIETMPVTIVEALCSATITSLEYPTPAELGKDITVTVNYMSNCPEDKELTLSLVRANIGGDFVDNGNGWETAGFVEAIALLPTAETGGSVDVSYTISGSEASATENLEDGQEWRLYAKLNNVDYTENVIEIVQNDIIDKVTVTGVTTTSGETISAGDTITIDYEFTSTEDAEIEFLIQLFESDGFTEVKDAEDSVIVVSNILYLTEQTASVDKDDVKEGTVTLYVDDVLEVLSEDLPNGQQYMAVAKLLHVIDGVNVYDSQSNSGVLITGLFNNKSESASFNAYPNPSANGTVRFSTEISNMIVVDALGNVVETAESATELNTSSLESGFYLLKSDQGSVRLVVE